MARENKTKATKISVTKFINSLPDLQQRKDSRELLKIYKDITKEKTLNSNASV